MWAAILTGGALLYRAQGTPVVVVALSIASFTYGGLLGGFFLGMLWKRAIQRDAILGMATAIHHSSSSQAAGARVPAFESSHVSARIAWPWYVLMERQSRIVAFCVLTHPPPTGEGHRWK